MRKIELETLRILCITQQLCKTGELNSFFLILQKEVEKAIKEKEEQKEVTAKW